MTRERRTAEDRRRQLIGIGLRMLTARPIHQVTIDEVAGEAGISRSLLFHYFPTKQDYCVEVVRAASRRLLREAGADTVAGMVAGYVAFIQRRRTQYVGLFRGSGQDDWVREIHDGTQAELTARVLKALGVAATPGLEVAVRAWWAFTEELVIESGGRGSADQEALTRLALSTLDHVVREA
ncbi:TetR/AcrR family transcriptional regulator [Actinokineospora pegani]|uniref:TetR/AcrR family transcriptional regulator n=1 Tax=Actinokineospora pegani TaxID=2654637 RepID=UPI0012E9A9B3|nr:TetR family transcriptional regulator [Actinokineospora pegani]